MHRWLLPGLIQCLSNIPLEQWNTMEATTNLGEAQHAWNNAQTGISMGAIESFKKWVSIAHIVLSIVLNPIEIRRARHSKG